MPEVDPIQQNLLQANKDLGMRVNKMENELSELKNQLREYLSSEKSARSRVLGSLTTMEKITSGVIQSLEVITHSFDSPAVSERRRIVQPVIDQVKQLKQLQDSLGNALTE